MGKLMFVWVGVGTGKARDRDEYPIDKLHYFDDVTDEDGDIGEIRNHGDDAEVCATFEKED